MEKSTSKDQFLRRRVPVRPRLGPILIAAALALGVIPTATAAEISLERPNLAERGAEELLEELEELATMLSPHSVHWLNPEDPTPQGSWALRDWSITDAGSNLHIAAKFTSPHLTAENPPVVGTCRRPLDENEERRRVAIENCLWDLLNRTLLDPANGFIGYVSAPVCKQDKDNIYRFSQAKLDAAGFEPGLSKIEKIELWPEMLLAMDMPRERKEPFLFRDPDDGYRGFVDLLRDCQRKDVRLEVENLSDHADLDLLDKEACTGDPVESRRLRIFLPPTLVTPAFFGLKGRTDPSGGR